MKSLFFLKKIPSNVKGARCQSIKLIFSQIIFTLSLSLNFSLAADVLSCYFVKWEYTPLDLSFNRLLSFLNFIGWKLCRQEFQFPCARIFPSFPVSTNHLRKSQLMSFPIFERQVEKIFLLSVQFNVEHERIETLFFVFMIFFHSILWWG